MVEHLDCPRMRISRVIRWGSPASLRPVAIADRKPDLRVMGITSECVNGTEHLTGKRRRVTVAYGEPSVGSQCASAPCLSAPSLASRELPAWPCTLRWGSFYGSNVAAARARGLRWCGAEMADEMGIRGQQGRELWLARNWANVGTPTSPHVGAVVVWPHHVGRIVGQENSQWVVRSSNDGGGVGSWIRSLAGAIAIREVGSGFAAADFERPQYRAS
jgi:hypothetical protein